jgi:regulation of enolase protein 1 (concanavalin A-like superfamily)
MSERMTLGRNRSRAAFADMALLGLALLTVGSGLTRWSGVVEAADPVPEQPALVAVETFKDKFHLNWKPVRPDWDHVSLTKNKGKLTITSQRGTIHADETARMDIKAKNIFVIDNPLAPDADFEVTTCITGFTPKQKYQQAALILYNDDDNYLKWTYEFSYIKGGSVALGLVRETKAEPLHDHVDPPEKAGEKLWLRLTKRKNSYEYSSSTDGKKFEVHGEKEWAEKSPLQIGILAKNGGIADVPEVDVCFERFELRSLPAKNQ